MTVSELISKLIVMEFNLPVVISGIEFGCGVDFDLEKVHQFDNCDCIRLIPGKAFEEGEE